MKTKLGAWTLNAKKWRKENGYITPEWEMFIDNRLNIAYILFCLSLSLGMALGYLSCLCRV